jgi:hypothetical protein
MRTQHSGELIAPLCVVSGNKECYEAANLSLGGSDMGLNNTVHRVTERIIARSGRARGGYLDKIARAQDNGVKRGHLTCGNQAHAFAAMGDDKAALVDDRAPNIWLARRHRLLEACPQCAMGLHKARPGWN